MLEIKTFTSNEFNNIRIIEQNGEPWFSGKDVCNCFGDKNHNRSLSRIDEEDKTSFQILDSMRRKQTSIFVNESGLYSLLFSMQPQKANNNGISDAYPIEVQERINKLHRFKHWVTSEVLPSIRKTGQYQLDDLSSEMQAIIMHDKKIVKMERRMDRLEFDIPLYGCEADEVSKHVKRKGIAILGGKNSDAYSDKSISQKVYADIYNQIKREYGLYGEDGKAKSYKALKRKYLNEVHELIEKYEAPTYIREMISESNAQLSFTS